MAQNPMDVLKLAGLIIDRTQNMSRFQVDDFPNENPDLEKFNVTICFYHSKVDNTISGDLRIYSRRIAYTEDSDDYHLYSNLYRLPIMANASELQKQLMVIANHVIPSITFDVFLGEFTSEKYSTKNDAVTIYNLVQKIFNTKNETCSVCMEKTTTKTPCNHSLCYLCWEKLQKLKCPCCRSRINYVTPHDVDQDIDDE